MSIQDAFLSALRADPVDAAARFVYADWLEEQGDPLAEFHRNVAGGLYGPCPSDSGKTFYWYVDEGLCSWSSYTAVPWEIEPEVFAHLKARHAKYGRTRRTAYRSLGAAYADLEQAWLAQRHERRLIEGVSRELKSQFDMDVSVAESPEAFIDNLESALLAAMAVAPAP